MYAAARPPALCVCVCVFSGDCGEKAMGEDVQWELVLHGFSKLTCWFLLGLWWSSNRRLKQLMMSSLFSVSVYIMADYWWPFSHWVHSEPPPVLLQLARRYSSLLSRLQYIDILPSSDLGLCFRSFIIKVQAFTVVSTRGWCVQICARIVKTSVAGNPVNWLKKCNSNNSNNCYWRRKITWK